MSIKPWNTGTGGCVACEDMPRKSIDIRLTDDPVPEEKGQLRPFPAIRRGRVRAEPEIGSRDWSLVGVGATPQGLKTINICNFQGSAKPIFSAQFFISHLTLPHIVSTPCSHASPAYPVSASWSCLIVPPISPARRSLLTAIRTWAQVSYLRQFDSPHVCADRTTVRICMIAASRRHDIYRLAGMSRTADAAWRIPTAALIA